RRTERAAHEKPAHGPAAARLSRRGFPARRIGFGGLLSARTDRELLLALRILQLRSRIPILGIDRQQRLPFGGRVSPEPGGHGGRRRVAQLGRAPFALLFTGRLCHLFFGELLLP